jgi:maltose phosphorylase
VRPLRLVLEDANWEEKFWEPLDVKNQEMKLCNGSNLQNTHFKVTTFMHNSILTNGENKYFAIQY